LFATTEALDSTTVTIAVRFRPGGGRFRRIAVLRGWAPPVARIDHGGDSYLKLFGEEREAGPSFFDSEN